MIGIKKEALEGIGQRHKQNKTTRLEQTPLHEVRFNTESDVPSSVVALSPEEYATTLAHIWPQTVKEVWDRDLHVQKIYEVVKDSTLPSYTQARIPIESGHK